MDKVANQDIKGLIEYAVDLGYEMREKSNEFKIEEIEGQTYVFHNGSYSRFKPMDPAKPDVFSTFSLQGLVDFIRADVDGLFVDSAKRHIVRVTSPTKVEVLTPLYGCENSRDLVAQCAVQLPAVSFDHYMDSEDFNIMIMTRFEKSEARDLVLKIIGNMHEEQSMQTADDGFSQRITVRTGVIKLGDTTVMNPIPLTPLRIFQEVDQPESPFVLRVQEGKQVALFESDGGAWKVKAVENICLWLREKLNECNVEIIA